MECNKKNTFRKNNAVEKGVMVEREPIDFKPKKIGFHINRLYSLLGKSGYIPALIEEFIKCLGNPTKMQGFVNSSLAEPWKLLITRAHESEILESRCDLAQQVVPSAAVALTAFVDPQKNGFWFVVRAWGRDYTSWLIHYGFLGTWEEVKRLLFETYYPIDDKPTAKTRIWRAGIDTGGGKFGDDPSMTEQAYWFVKKYMLGYGAMLWGTKGASGSLNQKVRLGKVLERTPSGKPIPGGLQIAHLDTSLLKDMFHFRLRQAREGGEQGAYLHKDTDRRYALQIMAEEKQINEKGLQEWVQVRADNHWLDCEIGAMALADIEWPGGGVHLLPGLIQIESRMKRITQPDDRGSRGVRFSRPDWLNR